MSRSVGTTFKAEFTFFSEAGESVEIGYYITYITELIVFDFLVFEGNTYSKK